MRLPKPTPFKAHYEGPPAEAEARLARALRDQRLTLLGASAFVGYVRGGSVRVARFRPWTRRACSPRFDGVITSADGSTVLQGVFHTTPLENTAVAIFAAGLVISSVVAYRKGNVPLLSVACACLVVLFGVPWLIRRGWALRQNDVRAIEDFIRASLAPDRMQKSALEGHPE
jgi:hypothetical protein